MKDFRIRKLTHAQLLRLLIRWQRDKQDTRDIHRHNAKAWKEEGDLNNSTLSSALAERDSAEIGALENVIEAMQGKLTNVLGDGGASLDTVSDTYVSHAERFAVCVGCGLAQSVTRSEAEAATRTVNPRDAFCWKCGTVLKVGREAKLMPHRGVAREV